MTVYLLENKRPPSAMVFTTDVIDWEKAKSQISFDGSQAKVICLQDSITVSTVHKVLQQTRKQAGCEALAQVGWMCANPMYIARLREAVGKVPTRPSRYWPTLPSYNVDGRHIGGIRQFIANARYIPRVVKSSRESRSQCFQIPVILKPAEPVPSGKGMNGG